MSAYHQIKFKKDRIAYLRTQLATNAQWATKGLLRIYEYQTADEQMQEATTLHNNVGFTGVDGTILSSFAKQILKGHTMSPKQMELIFKKMPKYANQLEQVAQLNVA